MNILSLFDGMSCGMIAMMLSGIKVDAYDAYEIDKYAIKVSTHNFPQIKQHGDVFRADYHQYEGYDWLVGGSPCTYWSIAQTKNRETEASGMGWELFSQYVRALHEAKPKYFIYENNKSMSAEIRRCISETFGFDPICINSALVSAQNRQRLYWVGIRQADGTYAKCDVKQPEDRGILLKDILETNHIALFDKGRTVMTSGGRTTEREFFTKHQGNMYAERVNIPSFPVNEAEGGKSHTLKAQYYKSGVANFLTNGGFDASAVAEPLCIAERGRYNEDGSIEQHYEVREDGKTNTLTTATKDNRVAEPIECYALDPDQMRDGTRRVGAIVSDVKNKDNDSQQYRVYTTEDKSVTLCGSLGGQGRQTGLYAVQVNTPSEVIEGGQTPPRMRVKEATSVGYTDIEPGNCVDMAMPNSETRRGRNMERKSNCLQTSCSFYQYCGTLSVPVYQVKDGKITVKGKEYPIKLVDGCYIIRKLTVRECMRLQTVPEWYDFSSISNSQAYKCLGNGWTCEVISHLINSVVNQVNHVNQVSQEKEKKEMELKINEYQLPSEILFNFDELKTEMAEKVQMYETIVYTADKIKEAKEDRAALNKLKSALNDERLRREKEYMIPFTAFKAKVNELIGIIDKPIAVIDKQVKDFEQMQRDAKLVRVKNMWEGFEHPGWIPFERVFDEKMLNASMSEKTIHQFFTDRTDKIKRDVEVIEALPEYREIALSAYRESFDLNHAINEAKKFAERQKAMEQKKEDEFAKNMNPPVVDEMPGQVSFTDAESFNKVVEEAKPVVRQWVSFSANLSKEDALALKEFFESRKIEFKRV